MRSSPYASEIRLLFLAAMGVFVVTVAIGILNGLDLVDFDSNTLLTHVHAGTLGWITLSAIATSFWLFGEGGSRPAAGERTLAWLAAVGIPVFVIAFFTGNLVARAVFALPVMLAIVWFLAWLWRAAGAAHWTTPRLAVVAAVITLIVGGTIGTLISIQLATGSSFLPGGAVEGHVVAMAFSYLILFGMAVAEWQLLPPAAMSRAGAVQVSTIFLAGMMLTVGAIWSITPLLFGQLLFELIGAGIFIWRLGPAMLGAPWLRAGPARQFAVSAVFVAIDVALLLYAVYLFGSAADPDTFSIPPWTIFALDHAVFVGVMTNMTFGLLLLATAESEREDWLAHVTFWGMNVGLVGFFFGLFLDQVVLKRIFSPIMGVSILIALAVFAQRLWVARESTA